MQLAEQIGDGRLPVRGRNGTVVSSNGDAVREHLLTAARAYAQVARGLGISKDEALEAVRTAL